MLIYIKSYLCHNFSFILEYNYYMDASEFKLSELTSIKSNTGLTHLGSEASIFTVTVHRLFNFAEICHSASQTTIEVMA